MLNLEKYDIILGSQSPRRQELLRGLNLNFRVLTIDVDETYPQNLQREEIPLYIAQKKAEAYKDMLTDNSLIITADTIVWHDGEVFGKPKDKDDAVRMLQRLSGKTHQVITGVCINSVNKSRVFDVITDVKFASLTDKEIHFYVENYKPFDKAGAYGIQEWIGFMGVESIDGSFYNVMGLPVQRLYNELKKWN
ncbi:MAG: Maf-like protein [Paludibacter sp.]|jgi:septum formation protein|nr:Maf-like protein [Paludibacter sp.]